MTARSERDDPPIAGKLNLLELAISTVPSMLWRAAIRVTYVDENQEPTDILVTNSNHNHQPDITMNYVVHCKRMIRDAIELNPLEPVLNIYEAQVAKMMQDIQISGDSLILEDYPRIMPTGFLGLVFFA